MLLKNLVSNMTSPMSSSCVLLALNAINVACVAILSNVPKVVGSETCFGVNAPNQVRRRYGVASPLAWPAIRRTTRKKANWHAANELPAPLSVESGSAKKGKATARQQQQLCRASGGFLNSILASLCLLSRSWRCHGVREWREWHATRRVSGHAKFCTSLIL